MTEDTQLPKKRTGLGRGLSSLLGEIQAETASAVSGRADAGSMPDGIRLIPIANLQPLPNQPRRNFDDEALDELARSITALGVLQPIVVRDMGTHFQIVAGERRWRAAQRAHLHQVPVIVKEFDDRTALEIALVENIQREQLNAWEEGETYRRLIQDYGHSQEELGRIVGKSRSHIANLMRLRNLPTAVHDWLVAGQLTMGHARALLQCENPESVAREVIARGLSVRETEKLAKTSRAPHARGTARPPMAQETDIAALERQLGDMLGLKVRIGHGARGGTVTLAYSSLDQLDLICQRLSGERI
ncbi:MAG: ParB/RepB/Spo0J family partition protein [Alphaproteobacteria bacterium]|jgi:ParB family chromosome partitioning protein|nr:ParB/RepB/Spo0J family partition protein [Alphaproteobacteria bacterium]